MEKIIDNLISKDDLFKTLENRFNKNIYRHPNIKWDEIASLLENDSEKISSLSYLETSGGEPDVTEINNQIVFIDFCKESPKERRSLCYDKSARVNIKTSSWLFTPDNIRQLGGAIFGDRRYDTTFIYHNGSDSYYASRGFRAKLILK